MEKVLRILKAYWILIVIVLVIVGGIAGYALGYRLDQAGITRVGNLVLTDLPDQTLVYIDEARRIAVAGGKASIALSPGTHSVIVAAPAHDPWNEIFTVAPAIDTVIAPILIPTTLTKNVLSGGDATKAAALIKAAKAPTKAAPLSLLNGCAHVYASGNRVIAEGAKAENCTPPSYLVCAEASSENPTGACAPTLIFSPGETVSSILPFPGRTDALVVWAGKTLYVVELDPREPQFIAPIFKGPITGVATWSATSVVVTNGTEIVELPL